MSDPESEVTIRQQLTQNDVRAAADSTLRVYGAEVYGFLAGVMDDPDSADDVFSRFSERVWNGLSRFRWECSLRTWCYTIARNELARHRAGTARNQKRVVGMSTAGSIRAPSAGSTPLFNRSSVLDAFAQLRNSLPAEDRDLLVLRVDRKLAWKDLAILFLGSEAPIDDLARESARLRKRFQLIKKQLADAATATGLLRG
jgi:RNA polymerase sigma-70 factor (ECF subfamily)